MISVRENTPVPSYMPFPRFLMETPFFFLSAEAKLLYVLMLDRTSISRENGYFDRNGNVKIFFTVEEVRQKLHKGKNRSITVIRELENCGLITRIKRGQGRPAVITLNYPENVRFIKRESA